MRQTLRLLDARLFFDFSSGGGGGAATLSTADKAKIDDVPNKIDKKDIATAAQVDTGTDAKKIVNVVQLKRKLGEKKIIPVATVADMTEKGVWYELTQDDPPAEKGVYWVNDAGVPSAIALENEVTGEIVSPFSDTFAGLPQIPSVTGKYHTILKQDDIGNGTADNPQYPEGIYLSSNGQWVFSGESLNADIVSLTDAQAKDVTEVTAGMITPKQIDLQRQAVKGDLAKIQAGTETIARSWDAKTLADAISAAGGTLVDNTTNTIDIKTVCDAMAEDEIMMIAPITGDKQITYSGNGWMPVFRNGVEIGLNSANPHTMPQGAIGFIYRHAGFYELNYHTAPKQQTIQTVKGTHNANEEFIAFGLRFRISSSGHHCPQVKSDDGSSHTAVGRVIGVDKNGVHAGVPTMAVDNTWKHLGVWDFDQIGDKVEWTFRYRGEDYRFTFIVFPSYQNNRFILEKL